MNTKNIIKRALFIACILTIGASAGFGQGLFGKIKDRVESKVKDEVKTQTDKTVGGSYRFARIEVRSSWEERAKKYYESA